MSFKVPEHYRVEKYSTASDGNNGAFEVWFGGDPKDRLFVIASDGGGWEHVSVSNRYRTPTWAEMCRMKDLFWDDPEDCVMQLHPPKSVYVNNHENCLHLWRPVGQAIPIPPSIFVGFK